MRLGFGPQDWDLGLETGIWASGLGFEGGTEEKKEEEEKIPHMCESIGHRPLLCRCLKRGGGRKEKEKTVSVVNGIVNEVIETNELVK